MLNNQTYLILEWFLFAVIFILGFVSFLKNRHTKKNQCFIIVCASLLLHLLFNISIITGYIDEFKILILIDQINGHLFPLALVYHLIDVTKVKIKPVFLFISLIIGSIISIIYYYKFLILSHEQQILFFENIKVFQPSNSFLIPILFIQISDTISVVYMFIINRKLKERTKIYLSENNTKTQEYSNIYVWMNVILLILCILFILFLPKQFAQFIMLPMVYYFFFFTTFLVYSGIPFFEHKQNIQIAKDFIENNIKETYKTVDNLEEQIKEVISTNKLYKNPDFTLFDLAKELSLGSKQLSNYINNNLNTNFVTLINNFRIEEAKNLLLDKQNLTLDAIAELSGFRNRITFYRVFKKIENIPPSAYKK